MGTVNMKTVAGGIVYRPTIHKDIEYLYGRFTVSQDYRVQRPKAVAPIAGSCNPRLGRGRESGLKMQIVRI